MGTAMGTEDFGGNMMQELIKNLILSASGLGLGFALYLGIRNMLRIPKTHGVHRRLNVAYAAARIGFVIVVALIAELVFRSPVPLRLDWRSVMYTIGVLLAASGYIGIALEGRKLPEDEQDSVV